MDTSTHHRQPLPAASDGSDGTETSHPPKPSDGRRTGRKKWRPESFDPNRARKERAKELRELKASVKELGARLEALHAVRAHESDKLVPASAPAEEHARELQVWEEIRQNQLSQRLEAEVENAHLKRAIEEARKLAAGLQRAAIKSSRSLSLHGVAVNLTSKIHGLLLDSEADAKMFEMMINEVDASYDEAQEIFHLNGLIQPGNEPRFGVQMHDGVHGRFMDMFSENILPFPVEDTARVVWKFYSGPAKHLGQVYFKTTKAINASSHETVAEKFIIEHHAMSMRRDFGIWQVLRRHVEEHRVLVVWIGVALPVENSHNPTTSVGYCQKGYVQCEPIGQGTEQTVTRLRRCHRITPYLPSGSEHNLTDREMREISAIMEWNLSLDFIRSHLQYFENQLLEESLRGRNQMS